MKKVLRVVVGSGLILSLLTFDVLAKQAQQATQQSMPHQYTPAQWLEKMVRAANTVSYKGRSIFHDGSRMMSLKIVHGMIDGEPWDRVVHLSGEPAEVLRQGKKISCLHPENAVELVVSDSSNSNDDLSLVNTFRGVDFVVPERYQLRMGGESRVAGRDVQIINVIPIDRARYGYHLGLDKETGLLLKTATLNKQQKVLEVFEFVDVSIGGPLTESDFMPGSGVQWVSVPIKSVPQVGSRVGVDWKAQWLPEGFHLAENEVRNIDGVNVNAQVYSDGLAAFTIFMEKVESKGDVEGSKQKGATIALSRRVTWESGNYMVTVVGEVPMEIAMQVAASVTKN